MNAPAKKRLGELLIDAGVIDETQLKAALGHQRQWGIRLGQALVDLKLATEHDVVKILAKRFGFEVARFDQVEAYAHQQAISLVPREFAAQHNVFPMAADTATLAVAMSDPTNLAVVDELRFRSGRRVKVTIGGDREVAAAIQAAYPSPDGGVEAIALDIDESADDGESVLDSFGGGSSEDFESFFGTDPAHLHGHETAPPAEDPFAAGPASAPVAVPVAHPGPQPAAARAPLAAPAVAPAPPAPAPRPLPATPGPAAPARAAPAPGARPAQSSAPVQPAAAPAARTPTVPAVRAVPVPGAAPVGPVVRAVPAPGAAASSAPVLRPAPGGPSRPVSPTPVRAPAPEAPRPAAGISLPLDLEFPSPDALRDIRARTGQAPAPPADPEEELSPLPEEPSQPAGAPLTAAEQAVLSALQRLADGGHAEPEVLKPTQAIAVLIRILLRKGLVTQREFLDALKKG